MSLDRSDVVDAVGTEPDGTVVLTIIDGWDWSDEGGHLRALQEKLNAYLHFIESGQLVEEYPAARNALLRVDVRPRLPFPASASALIDNANLVARSLRAGVSYVAPSFD